MCIHKTVVLWLVVGASTSGDCLVNHRIDCFSALRRQAHKHFGAFRGITNCFGRKGLEPVFSQEHDEDVLAHNHAGSRLVGELRIKAEAKFGEKLNGLIELFDG